MMIGGFPLADEQVSPGAQSGLAHSMISTIGRDAAISACWANQWFGVLEEIYAQDRSALKETGPNAKSGSDANRGV